MSIDLFLPRDGSGYWSLTLRARTRWSRHMWEIYGFRRRRGNYFFDRVRDVLTENQHLTVYTRIELGTRRRMRGFVRYDVFKVRGKRITRLATQL